MRPGFASRALPTRFTPRRRPRVAISACRARPSKVGLWARPPRLRVDVEEPPGTPGRIVLEQPAVPAVVTAIGVLLLGPASRAAAPLVAVAAHGRRVDLVVTGMFMPAIGLLFAMLSSTAVVTLRQRQEDCRNVLNLELAALRMLVSMVDDREVVLLLYEYARALDVETFSHRANGISYRANHGGFGDADEHHRREQVFAYADDILHAAIRRVNVLRMRGEVETEVRELVALRSRRRATLDTGLPQVHFTIIGVLGFSILFSFVLLVAGEQSWLEVPAVTIMWTLMLGVFTWGAILIADLRDPFRGHYRLSRARMRRTIRLLRKSQETLSEPLDPSMPSQL